MSDPDPMGGSGEIGPSDDFFGHTSVARLILRLSVVNLLSCVNFVVDFILVHRRFPSPINMNHKQS